MIVCRLGRPALHRDGLRGRPFQGHFQAGAFGIFERRRKDSGGILKPFHARLHLGRDHGNSPSMKKQPGVRSPDVMKSPKRLIWFLERNSRARAVAP
jgi:hypothetical protein